MATTSATTRPIGRSRRAAGTGSVAEHDEQTRRTPGPRASPRPPAASRGTCSAQSRTAAAAPPRATTPAARKHSRSTDAAPRSRRRCHSRSIESVSSIVGSTHAPMRTRYGGGLDHGDRRPVDGRTRWAVLGPGVISGFFARALRRSTSGALHAVGQSGPCPGSGLRRRARRRGERHLRRDPAARRRRRRLRGHRAHHPRRAGDRRPRGRQGRALREARHPDSVRHPGGAGGGASGRDCRSWRRTSTASDRSPPALRQLISDGRDRSAAARRCLLRRGGDRAHGQAVRTRAGRRGDPRRRRLSGLARGRDRHLGRTGRPPAPARRCRSVTGLVGDTGVDEWTSAAIDLGGLLATVHTSLVADQVPRVVIRGSAGSLELPSIWGSRTASGAEAVVRTTGAPRRITVPVVDPMAAEADAVSLALAEGRTEVPEMTWAETTLVAETLHLWRAGLD